MSRALLRAIAVALLCGAGLSVAETASADPADEAYAAGNKSFDAGDFAGAELHYEEAFRLRRSPDIAGNLAQAELELRKRTEAAEHLSYAIRLLPVTTRPEARAAMEAKMAELRGALCEITIETNVPATISVGGREIGKTPLEAAIFVEPGTTQISASAPDREPAQQTVNAAAGSATRVRLVLPARGVGGGGLPKWPGFLIGGLGVVGVAVGGALFGVSAGAASDAEDLARGIGSCPTQPTEGPCADLAAKASDETSLHNAGLATMVAGGGVLAASVIYVIVAYVTDKPRESPPAATIIPWIAPSMLGASYSITF